MPNQIIDKYIYPLTLFMKNIPGPRVSGRMLIIECDDWGGIRMPSKEVHKKLVEYGIPVNESVFDRLDTMACKEDLDELFEALLSVRDTNGNPAVMTPVINVANPDFRRIREADFTQYFHEPFTDTIERYYPGSNTFKTWMEGIRLGVFSPEYHGREHISVQPWLQKLRTKNKRLLYAFENEYVAVPNLINNNPIIDGFRAELYFDHPSQISFYEEAIPGGIKLFKDIIGYIPRTFAPSNGVFYPDFENIISGEGINYLYVNHFNYIHDSYGNLKKKYYRIGSTSKSGITYYTRNCVFEPSNPRYKGVEFTLRQINVAFRLGKPAIISTHRVNFVGGISPSNREKGINELRLLLRSILKEWPDTEFVSTNGLINTRFKHVTNRK